MQNNCTIGMKPGDEFDLSIHKYLFLNPAFIQFTEKIRGKTKEMTREMFSMLDGIVLIDAIGDLDAYQSRIDDIADHTGLPILERKDIGLSGFKNVLLEALDRNRRKQSAHRQRGE